MNSHAKWLRRAAVVCLKAKLVNIANTCEQAANEIDSLQQFHDWAEPQITDLKRSVCPTCKGIKVPSASPERCDS